MDWCEKIAAVGAGEFKNVAEACEATVKTVEQTKPVAAARKVYDKDFGVYQGLYGALKEEFRKVAGLIDSIIACDTSDWGLAET